MIGTEPSRDGAILRKIVATAATDNFTMSCWFKNRPGANTNCLAYNGNQTGSGFGFQMSGLNNLIALYGGVVVGAQFAVAEEQWHHAVLFRRAGTSQMIVDGSRFSATWANAPIAPNPGVDELRMFETNAPFNTGIGATSEVGVWTVPLTLDQCAALAGGAKPDQIGPRPAFYWTGFGVTDRITGVAMTGNSYRMLRGPDLRVISLPFAIEVPVDPSTILAPPISATTTLYTPNLVPGAPAFAPFIASTTTLYTHGVALHAFGPSLIAATTTLYEPTMRRAQIVVADRISATHVFAPYIARPLVNVSPPAISGVASEGNQLEASEGVWSGTEPITYAYQWRRCNAAGASCADIAGETGKTYIVRPADVGSTLRIRVTASNG